MQGARPPAVAGSFYPAFPPTLQASVDQLLGRAKGLGPRPKALVVPHAGYVYSGAIAASAYAQLRAPLPTRVILLGPSHFAPLRGLALPDAPLFETPLGLVPVDARAASAIAGFPGVLVSGLAHAREHSLEVQLPFLQRVLPHFSVVPLAIGRATVEQVEEVIEALWGGDETLLVVSTDLSHYLTYDEARKLDGLTARSILDADEAISDTQACGACALRGLLRVAQRRGLRSAQLDLRSSGDTSGDRRRVVGYGAFAFYEPEPEARAELKEGATP